ncbi:MAG TPA: LacI family DNA-binding transcriptional regulator [Terracidiphilus sp.]|nr:LacI family DNA-binding transcriptional regulator [Terracidiphilus sp.]
MPVSIREIAKLAGVSSATVSRVINSSSLVTADTTERIQRIIQQVNFVPNRSAVHLKNGKSQIFGAIIPDVTNPFFMELVKIFESVLVENDLELLIANTDFHQTRTQRSIHRMLLRRVDGVAFLTSEVETAELESLVQNRIPVVTTDHYRTAPGMSDIVVDFRNGMWQLIQHLKGLGHQQVGFIGGTEGLATSRNRRESFMDAVVSCGMASQDGWIVAGDYRVSGGAAGMRAILENKEIPTAVVTANDLTAIGALRTAHESGLRIPDDISIAGCDDIEMADIVYPPLTTLRISRRQYAQMLFDALRISAQDLTQPGRVFNLPMKLVVRESTGPAPKRSLKGPVMKSAKAPTRRPR